MPGWQQFWENEGIYPRDTNVEAKEKQEHLPLPEQNQSHPVLCLPPAVLVIQQLLDTFQRDFIDM